MQRQCHSECVAGTRARRPYIPGDPGGWLTCSLSTGCVASRSRPSPASTPLRMLANKPRGSCPSPTAHFGAPPSLRAPAGAGARQQPSSRPAQRPCHTHRCSFERCAHSHGMRGLICVALRAELFVHRSDIHVQRLIPSSLLAPSPSSGAASLPHTGRRFRVLLPFKL